LTRASIPFVRRWIAGSSPAMTTGQVNVIGKRAIVLAGIPVSIYTYSK
jgi:hypothetical protein